MRFSRSKELLIGLVAFVGALVYLAAPIHVEGGGKDVPEFHNDEAHKLGEAYYFQLFFVERDWKHPSWTEDFYSRMNPPLAKYIFGFALRMGGHPVLDQALQEDFTRLWQSPAELRKCVPDGMLRITRFVSALFGAGVCALLALAGCRAAGPAAGLLAGGLVLANPHFVVTARRGLTDTILHFHLLLILPALFWALRVLAEHWTATAHTRPKHARTLLATVLWPGLVVALATSSKQNGALTGIVYGLALMLGAAIYHGIGRAWVRLGASLAASIGAGLVSWLLFCAFDPYLHEQAFTRAINVPMVLGDWMVRQQILPGGGLFSFGERAASEIYLCFASAVTPWMRPLGSVGSWFLGLSTCFGLVTLTGRALLAGDGKDRVDAATAGAVLTWSVTCALIATLVLPVIEPRYILVPYLAVCLVGGIGMAKLPSGVRTLVQSLRNRSTARRRLQVLASVLTTIFLCWALAPATRFPHPEVLEPPTGGDDPREAAVRTYAEALRTHPDSMTARRYLASALLTQGKFAQAEVELESALSKLDPVTDDRSRSALKCSLLSDLALARHLAKNWPGMIETLEEFQAEVESLRSAMKTSDPWVRQEYEKVIQLLQASIDQARAR
jgi:hypothetical protein